MFEKEAEEWVKENMDCCKTDNFVNQSIPYFGEEERCIAKSAFQRGAEFGYNKANKANEWHDLRKDPNDLPKDEDWKWCVSYRGYYYVAKYEERFECWTNQEYSEVMKPYAWKETVLPELKESE